MTFSLWNTQHQVKVKTHFPIHPNFCLILFCDFSSCGSCNSCRTVIEETSEMAAVQHRCRKWRSHALGLFWGEGDSAVALVRSNRRCARPRYHDNLPVILLDPYDCCWPTRPSKPVNPINPRPGRKRRVGVLLYCCKQEIVRLGTRDSLGWLLLLHFPLTWLHLFAWF